MNSVEEIKSAKLTFLVSQKGVAKKLQILINFYFSGGDDEHLETGNLVKRCAAKNKNKMRRFKNG